MHIPKSDIWFTWYTYYDILCTWLPSIWVQLRISEHAQRLLASSSHGHCRLCTYIDTDYIAITHLLAMYICLFVSVCFCVFTYVLLCGILCSSHFGFLSHPCLCLAHWQVTVSFRWSSSKSKVSRGNFACLPGLCIIIIILILILILIIIIININIVVIIDLLHAEPVLFATVLATINPSEIYSFHMPPLFYLPRSRCLNQQCTQNQKSMDWFQLWA